MIHELGAEATPRRSSGGPDQTDRILFIACAVAWLAALGAAVAAIVALVDLGQAHATSAAEPDTPWLLYTVIGVSALVIIGAIPLLIRARRTAIDGGARSRSDERGGQQNVFGPPLGTEGRQRIGGPAVRRQPPATSRVGFPIAAVEQLWVRSTVALATAIGAATAASGLGTYLMASGYNGSGWAAYAVAAVVTVGMAAIPWFYLKQLRALLD